MPKSNIPYDILKDLLEAHIAPIQQDLKEIKSIAQEGIRANTRLDKHENRLYGLLMGTGIGSGSLGAFLSHWFTR